MQASILSPSEEPAKFDRKVHSYHLCIPERNPDALYASSNSRIIWCSLLVWSNSVIHGGASIATVLNHCYATKIIMICFLVVLMREFRPCIMSQERRGQSNLLSAAWF
mmetsp:Transcript_9401/g.28075  ORF Transcript_9401/g.28075 Transcript_9401/m.28075 type:complete len:108 (+) Transcript_9401:399-722(+)